MSLTAAQLGFARAIGVAIVMSILTYLGDASHLNGIVSTSVAAIISALALSLEHNMESKDDEGKALFGTTSVKA